MIELFDKEITKNDDEIMIGECLLTIVDKIKSAYTLFIRDLDTDLAHKVILFKISTQFLNF